MLAMSIVSPPEFGQASGHPTQNAMIGNFWWGVSLRFGDYRNGNALEVCKGLIAGLSEPFLRHDVCATSKSLCVMFQPSCVYFSTS